MIKLENISKNYGDHIIFDNMSITFDEENSLNGIIGKSGSGKTTLFNILFGLESNGCPQQIWLTVWSLVTPTVLAPTVAPEPVITFNVQLTAPDDFLVVPTSDIPL